MPSPRKSRKQRDRQRRYIRDQKRKVAVLMKARVRRRIAKAKIDEARRYFVAQTHQGFERRARDRLADQGLDVYAPLEEVERTRRGKVTTAIRPVLPRMLFVGVPRDEDGWIKAIKDTPGIADLLRFGERYVEIRPVKDKPHPLQEFADELADDEEPDEMRGLPYLGEQVRVADGPFASFNGIVEEVDGRTQRLKVSVDIFGRPTPVALELAQVERM